MLRNKPFHGGSFVRMFVLVVWVGTIGSARANTPKESLGEYFELLARADSPTSLALVEPSSRFWLKGAHSGWLEVNRYFYFHRPAGWKFTEQANAGDYMSIRVLFDSVNANQPWLTEFELVRAKSGWKIIAFTDITLRPFDEQSGSAQSLVFTYLEKARHALGTMAQGINQQEQARLEKYYGNGAGFWYALPTRSRLFLLWLEQQAPATYEIANTSTVGDKSSIVVEFMGTKGRAAGHRIKFEVVSRQSRLFITQYHDMERVLHQAELNKAADKVSTAIDKVTWRTDSPAATVSTQLEILRRAGSGPALYAVLPDIVERSKPLWASSRRAKATLGRLIGVFVAFNAQGRPVPTWELISAGTVVTAHIVNPESFKNVSKFMQAIQFSLSHQVNGWKIVDAVIFRE